ncbi:MAG: sensor histidine kinase [Mycobacteriales bacterium]
MRLVGRLLSAAWNRLGDVVYAAGILPFFAVDGFYAVQNHSGWERLLGLCGMAVILTSLPRRRSRVATGVVAVAVSVATTVVLGLRDTPARPHEWGIGEMLALVVLTIGVIRYCRTRTAVTLGGALVLATVAQPLRDGLRVGLPVAVFVSLLVGVALVYALHQRYSDDRRARAVAAVRQSERLELARDLHDFLGHYVTGIVVQVQAARKVAASRPEAVEPILATIEQAGVDALTSMRRMVGVLRADEDSARPLTGVTEIRQLLDRFREAGPDASLLVDPELGTLPPEAATTLHRIVQEALTNVRRHAPDAQAVRVRVDRVAGGVEVRVGNDGGQSHRRRLLPSGGFGIVGLTERVEALGGWLRAGPAERGGWEVVAHLPC